VTNDNVDLELNDQLQINVPAGEHLEMSGNATEVAPTQHMGRTLGTLVLVVLLGIALIAFMVQNTRSVRISFFSANGHIPVIVALLGASLVGASVVLCISSVRGAKLHLSQRRHERKRSRPPSTATPSLSA
jgi:lipopolysaccharide assembly protein A